MRQESAASSKGYRPHSQLIPREGTYLRSIYDLLQQHKATPLTLPKPQGGKGQLKNTVDKLRDFYGLDVRVFSRHTGGNRRGPKKKFNTTQFWLVGEWFGSTYVDYIAQERERQERELERNETGKS